MNMIKLANCTGIKLSNWASSYASFEVTLVMLKHEPATPSIVKQPDGIFPEAAIYAKT